MGIVIELQKECLEGGSDVETLLRKAMVIAKKLRLDDFEKWIRNEQEGYITTNVPRYRKVKGTIKAFNPAYGMVPVVLNDSEIEDILCTRPICDAVSKLSELSKEETLTVQITGDINKKLCELMDFNTQFYNIISGTDLKKILASVKNILLDWTLKLEELGIVGDGLTFSDEEKNKAETSKELNTYIINIYGDVNDSQIQQATDKSEQKSNKK